MIEMFAGGRNLVVGDDVMVRVEINSSAFETDSIPVSVVYQFDLPIQGNEEALGYANCPEVVDKYREIDWRMSYAGIPLFCGRLVVLSSRRVFRCAATLNSFPTDFPERDLCDVFPEKMEMGSSVSNFVYRMRKDLRGLVAFPTIYAPNCYGGDNSSNPDWDKGLRLINGEQNQNTTLNNTSLIPLYRVANVLSQVFHSIGYSMQFTGGVLDKLLIFNNYTLDALEASYYAFNNFAETRLIKGLTIDLSMGISHDESGCFQGHNYIVRESGNYRISVILTANYKGVGEIETREVSFGIFNGREEQTLFTNTLEYVGYSRYDFINDETEVWLNRGDAVSFRFRMKYQDLEEIWLFPNLAFTIKTGILEIERTGTRENVFQKEIIHRNHLPEMSVSDFLLLLKQNYGMTYFWDEKLKTVDVFPLVSMFETGWLDLTLLCIEADAPEIELKETKGYLFKYNGDIPDVSGYNFYKMVDCLADLGRAPLPKMLGKIRNTNSYYQSELKDGRLEWSWLGNAFGDFRSMSEIKMKEDVDVKAVPMGMIEYRYELYPYFASECVSQAFAPNTSRLDKVMFLLQRSDLVAGSTAYDRNGVYHAEWLSLEFDGDNGIYNRLLRKWYEFLAGANEYIFDFKVGVEDMLRILELFRPQYGPLAQTVRQVRIKSQLYIPKQFTFELTNKGIKCKGKLMKDDKYRGSDPSI